MILRCSCKTFIRLLGWHRRLAADTKNSTVICQILHVAPTCAKTSLATLKRLMLQREIVNSPAGRHDETHKGERTAGLRTANATSSQPLPIGLGGLRRLVGWGGRPINSQPDVSWAATSPRHPRDPYSWPFLVHKNDDKNHSFFFSLGGTARRIPDISLA